MRRGGGGHHQPPGTLCKITRTAKVPQFCESVRATLDKTATAWDTHQPTAATRDIAPCGWRPPRPDRRQAGGRGARRLPGQGMTLADSRPKVRPRVDPRVSCRGSRSTYVSGRQGRAPATHFHVHIPHLGDSGGISTSKTVNHFYTPVVWWWWQWQWQGPSNPLPCDS